MEYVFLLPILAASALLVFGSLLLSRLLAPHKPNPIKNDIYECGEKTIGSAWVQFNVGYFHFGLLFLVFDVEAVFLYLWAITLRNTGLVGLFEAFVFIFVLLIGLAYAWRKGVLEWV